MQYSLRRFIRLGCFLVLSVSCGAQAGDLFDRTATRYKLSPDLLRSIALVESEMYPWAVNINWESFKPESPFRAVQLIQNVQKNPWLLRVDYADTSHRLFFRTGPDAQAALRDLRQRAKLFETELPWRWEIRKLDVHSVDIGLMQINWKFHGRHFESMEQLFDPATNLDYAARYLRRLLTEHGDLETAVAYYHSNTQEFQDRYLEFFRSVYQKQLIQSRRG